jgi:hypothetical protein
MGNAISTTIYKVFKPLEFYTIISQTLPQEKYSTLFLIIHDLGKSYAKMVIYVT